MDESVANEGVFVDTELSDLSVELRACGGRGKYGAGAEEKGKSKVVELGASAFHADGERKSLGGVGGVGGTAYDGIPHEVIWLGNLVEKLAGIDHGAWDGDGGGEEKLAQGVVVGEEAPNYYQSVDLLQAATASAHSP